MKFKLDRKLFMEHVVLTDHKTAMKISDTPLWEGGNGVLEATLQINGVDVPAQVLEDFMKSLWERAKVDTGAAAFRKQVIQKAEEIVEKRARKVLDAFDELQNKLESSDELIKWNWKEDL